MLKTLDKFIAVDLRDDLHDPDFALGYLQACFEEAKTNGSPNVFFAAVQDVARANEVAEDESKSGAKPQPHFATKSNRARDVEERELVCA